MLQPLNKPAPENTCFLACLKIIGEDLGFAFDIAEFIEAFPDLCHKGGKDGWPEGGFHVTQENLAKISDKSVFKARLLLKLEPENTPDARFIFSCHRYQEDDKAAHCLVFVEELANDNLLVINPASNKYQRISTASLKKWKANVVEVRKAAESAP
jgi:hypothetical protein